MRYPKPRKRAKLAKKAKRSSRKALVAQCDRLWSQLVKRGGQCHFAGKTIAGKSHKCMGPLQAMHLISRRFHTTRWDLDNGLPGCAGAHMYYTCNSEEWGLYLVQWWGIAHFETMLGAAHSGVKVDLQTVLAGLLEEERQN